MIKIFRFQVWDKDIQRYFELLAIDFEKREVKYRKSETRQKNIFYVKNFDDVEIIYTETLDEKGVEMINVDVVLGSKEQKCEI